MKIKNEGNFTLSAQTSFALRRTLCCHAALIEALERHYGQYRQMSGDRLLVSLKDVNCYEKNLDN